MTDRAPGPQRWLPRFVLLSAIWGSSFALIKIAVEAGVEPTWVALWRCLFGALALIGVCVVRRAAFPRDRAVWGHAAVVAALSNALPFTLFAFGENHVSSVVAGVWNATTPLTTLLFVLALVPQEPATARRIAGLGLGFAGVLVVLGIWRGLEGGTVLGSFACLGATTGYGAGFAYTRRYFSGRSEPAEVLTATQLTCASAELGVAAFLVDGPPSWPGLPGTGALVVLGAVGTGAAFLLNMGVIRSAGPTIASTVTYLTPLWSTLLGAVLLSEPLGWNTVAGGLLIISGVVLTRRTSTAAGNGSGALARR